MIEKALLISNENKLFLDVQNQEQSFVFDCSTLKNSSQFNFEITFEFNIIAFRNHDYTWVDLNEIRIATEFSPKILKLENGTFVQSNLTFGIWETDSRNHKKLYWKFNPDYSKPITKYRGSSNAKTIVQATSKIDFDIFPALLFSKNFAIEISRSKIPFSAVLCFTDHCDFDTLENLKVQRNFFKEKNIKVTKGFFLHHFSKRATNASLENDKSELELWQDDGHELCYHSLSQSIKSEEESISDFKNFVPPFPNTPVWIDHGYQPYNFSLFEKNRISSKGYEILLQEKNITLLWNYIDSGTATSGVINQLNPTHFTLQKFAAGLTTASRMKLAQDLIKNVVFHYLNDEKTITRYKTTAQNFKKMRYQKDLKVVPTFFKNFFQLSASICLVFFSWRSSKKKPYKVAKYGPLFFNHTIANQETTIFQTVEMIDFEKSLSQSNVDLLIQESGICLAHTYFSDTIAYHSGKLLTSNNEINPKVNANFDYLKRKIATEKIWNPTLSELYTHLQQFENLLFEVDSEGTVQLQNSSDLNFRKVY
jgi:hypothetical protein